MKVINLNQLVAGIKRMLEIMAGDKIDLTIELSDSPGFILADAGQIERIILNMTVYAREAMVMGGRLNIGVGEVMLTGKERLRDKNILPGRYATLVFTDIGEETNGSVRERIFESFITDKPDDMGKGPGLSTVLEIVRQHKGYIGVQNDVGKGTTFTMFFPMTEKKGIGKTSPISEAPVRESATILAVDDNLAMRNLIIDILEPLGYKVLLASSGNEALEISRTKEEKIDLLLTDVVMPGMSGRQLINKLQSERPGLKAILMSGYPADIVGPDNLLEPHLNFISKPFVQTELIQKINQVLEESVPPPGDS